MTGEVIKSTDFILDLPIEKFLRIKSVFQELQLFKYSVYIWKSFKQSFMILVLSGR